MSILGVKCKIIDQDFISEFGLPSSASPHSAAVDLRANLKAKFGASVLTLAPGETQLIPTGISFFINNPHYAGFIYPRSGLGHKQGLVLGNLTGVIDADYQGEIFVSLWNRSSQAQTITHGDRIAQLVVQRVYPFKYEIVEDYEETARGEGGFGSTGRN